MNPNLALVIQPSEETSLLSSAENKRILVVVDPNVWAHWDWKIREFLSPHKERASYCILPDDEPRIESLRRMMTGIVSEPPQVLISIGGGSTIDSAKFIKWELNDARPDDYILIAVPTTIGPGAEASPAAIIRVGGTKRAFVNIYNRPDYVLLRPEFSETLPKRLAYSCLIDGIAHSFEAATRLGCTSGCKNLATSSAAILFQGIWKWSSHSDAFRSDLIRASVNASMALSQSGVHLIHAIARVAEMKSGARHSECVAAALNAVLGIAKELEINTILNWFFEELNKGIPSRTLNDLKYVCSSASVNVQMTSKAIAQELLTYPGLNTCPIAINEAKSKMINDELQRLYEEGGTDHDSP